jgi:sugar diacid utilization regulator
MNSQAISTYENLEDITKTIEEAEAALLLKEDHVREQRKEICEYRNAFVRQLIDENRMLRAVYETEKVKNEELRKEVEDLRRKVLLYREQSSPTCEVELRSNETTPDNITVLKAGEETHSSMRSSERNKEDNTFTSKRKLFPTSP